MSLYQIGHTLGNEQVLTVTVPHSGASWNYMLVPFQELISFPNCSWTEGY